METRHAAHPGRLVGKVALITGVNAPMGRAVAWHAAREGARLVLSDADGEAIEALHGELAHVGTQACIVAAPTHAEEGAKQAAFIALRRFGRIDTLIHTVTVHPSLEERIDIDIAGLAPMVLKGASAMRLQAEGNVVVAAFIVPAGEPEGYAAACAAAEDGIAAFVQDVAAEFYGYGVTVNGVVLHDHASGRTSPSSAHVQFIDAYRRASRFEDVARAAGFLASSEARGITGHTLVVAGGAPPCTKGERRPRQALRPIEEVYRLHSATEAGDA